MRVAGVLLAVALAGCGGGGGAGTLDRQAYAAKLSAMCADFSAREKTIGAPQTLHDLATKGQRIVDAFDQAIRDKVRVLKASDSIAAQAQRFRDLADRQHDVLAALVAAGKRNDAAKAIPLVAKNQALNEEARSVARSLGATACAAPAG
jgi:hypothetical protein